MSYAFRRTAPLVFSIFSAAACVSPAPSEADDTTRATSALAASTVTVTFGASGAPVVTGALTVGESLTVAYDAARLTGCRGDTNGHAAWVVTGFYQINGGAIGAVDVGGYVPPQGANATFALTQPGTLDMWFQNTSLWGCSAWDSAFGQNYHFTILPAANAPGFLGNAVSVVSRATCNNGGPCDADRAALSKGFHYDTWARQRAAIRNIYFDIWKEGVTDFDNANLWQQLDVEVHSRVVGEAAFTTRYVAFDHRVGHDARFVVPMASLDPLGGGPNGSSIASAADCPTFATTLSGPPGSQYIDADVEMYFTVNGSELRPTGGGLFRGTFENYEGLYAVCRK